ncbi:MAG TPA: alpha/beta fold hydrolase, partial [Thermoanaerobaculia bacterium]|nr:alpha/beta fold hydrolase [Thermoanaerobaculia bacterium]
MWRTAVEPAPLVVFSHAALQGKRSATYLCEFLAAHGYTVAAIDHAEVVEPKLGRRDGETEDEKLRRWQTIIDRRVPDIRLLLDMLQASRAGVVGHSLGGWTALAAAEADPRIASVVALAPAGASNPRPGVLPAMLTYVWPRDVPVLIIAAENDTSLPL